MRSLRCYRRRRGLLLGVCAILLASEAAFPPWQVAAQRRKPAARAARTPGRPATRGGSVRTANRTRARRSPASPAGTARRTTRRRTAARGRTAYKAHRNRYKYWKDARRDYYRWRTINTALIVGARIAAKPKQTTTVVVTGTTYYYSGGVYYVKSGNEYVVVNAPPGAVVYAVPTYTTVVYVNETPYYYHAGTYYVHTAAPANKPPPETNTADDGEKDEQQPELTEDEENYKVVAPPVGASVPYLPEEADEETVDGKKYFVFNGTYYRPFSSEGDTVFMVVEGPCA
ncbi:MAG: DUF6515 family protein [Planctomycetota bacterium]